MKARSIIPNIMLNICVTFFKLPVIIISRLSWNLFLARKPLKKCFHQAIIQYYNRSFAATLIGIFLQTVRDSYKQIASAINVVAGIRMFMSIDFLSLLFVRASWISICFFYASGATQYSNCKFHAQNTQNQNIWREYALFFSYNVSSGGSISFNIFCTLSLTICGFAFTI